MLYDMTAIDERVRNHREGQPPSDFTVVYHLLSFERNASLRIKVALLGEYPSLPTITDTWPAANWYEREVWDMFGITFDGHLHMTRLLLPPTWDGHPLRKEHPARATEMGEYRLPGDKQDREQEALRFKPEDWGMKSGDGNTDFMFLNLGPNHPGVHGVFRIILQLDGEEIVDAVPDIGYHHRGAEKMAERQSWHSYIPYTDRIDYLGGVMNNLPYVLAVEKLAGIVVPDRVKVIRVMMASFFELRVTSFFTVRLSKTSVPCRRCFICFLTASAFLTLSKRFAVAACTRAGFALAGSRMTYRRAGIVWWRIF